MGLESEVRSNMETLAWVEEATEEQIDEMIRGRKMKVLITGADGMLGNEILKAFEDWDIVTTDKEELDVRFWSDIQENLQLYDLIIHLAAETDLEICEKMPEHAYFTNTTGTQNMVELAKICDCPIVYISTAGIFDGKKEIYEDDDKPNPRNHYGRSKYYGELIVRAYPKHYVFRAGWMIGGGQHLDKKFINKIYKQIKSGTREIFALEDVYGSPTYTKDLARTIKYALDNDLVYGAYNCSGKGRCSRYEVAQVVLDTLNLVNFIKLTPVTMGFFKEKFFCPRVKNEALANTKLEMMGLSKMRHWEDTVREYIYEHYH